VTINTNNSIPTITQDGTNIVIAWRDGAGDNRFSGYDMGDAIGSAVGFCKELVLHTYLMGWEQAKADGEAEAAVERMYTEGPDLAVNYPGIWYVDGSDTPWMTLTAEHGEVGFPTIEAAFMHVCGALGHQPTIYQVSDEAREQIREQAMAEMAEAYRDGYANGGAEGDVTTPDYGGNARLRGEFESGVYIRRANNESGQRIEALIGQAREARDERDALATSVEQLREQLAAVEAERDEWKAAATPQGSDLVNRVQEYERVVAQRDATIVANNEQYQARVTQLSRTINQGDADWQHFAEAFLQEAIDRDWCSDYESFTERVSSGMSRFEFLSRSRTYRDRIWVDVTFEADHNQDEDEIASEMAREISRVLERGGRNVVDYGHDGAEVDDD
jgi:hypothetical protein